MGDVHLSSAPHRCRVGVFALRATRAFAARFRIADETADAHDTDHTAAHRAEGDVCQDVPDAFGVGAWDRATLYVCEVSSEGAPPPFATPPGVGDRTVVSVSEGIVEATDAHRTSSLSAGMQMRLGKDESGQPIVTARVAVGAWREGQRQYRAEPSPHLPLIPHRCH